MLGRRSTHHLCDHTHNPNLPALDEDESDEEDVVFGEGDYEQLVTDLTGKAKEKQIEELKKKDAVNKPLFLQIIKINDPSWKEENIKDFHVDQEYTIKASGYPDKNNLSYKGDGSVYFGRGGKKHQIDISYPTEFKHLSRQQLRIKFDGGCYWI